MHGWKGCGYAGGCWPPGDLESLLIARNGHGQVNIPYLWGGEAACVIGRKVGAPGPVRRRASIKNCKKNTQFGHSSSRCLSPACGWLVWWRSWVCFAGARPGPALVPIGSSRLACSRRVWTPTALSHRGNVGGIDFDGGGLTDEVNRDDQAVGFLLSDENPLRALEGPPSHLYRHSDV